MITTTSADALDYELIAQILDYPAAYTNECRQEQARLLRAALSAPPATLPSGGVDYHAVPDEFREQGKAYAAGWSAAVEYRDANPPATPTADAVTLHNAPLGTYAPSITGGVFSRPGNDWCGTLTLPPALESKE